MGVHLVGTEICLIGQYEPRLVREGRCLFVQHVHARHNMPPTKRFGSRAEVLNGVASSTRGCLQKPDLKRLAGGQIVSLRRKQLAKQRGRRPRPPATRTARMRKSQGISAMRGNLRREADDVIRGRRPPEEARRRRPRKKRSRKKRSRKKRRVAEAPGERGDTPPPAAPKRKRKLLSKTRKTQLAEAPGKDEIEDDLRKRLRARKKTLPRQGPRQRFSFRAES